MSLKFKGDKPKKSSKKRSHREIEDGTVQEDGNRGEGTSSSGGMSTVKQRYGKNPEGWVLLMAQEDLFGPTFLTSSSALAKAGEPLALATNPINYRVQPFSLPSDMTAQEGEPTTVDTIWRCARVPESADKVTFKSSQDRYLACSQVGEISAEREARGAEEEFLLEPLAGRGKGAYAIRSAAWGSYLSVDEVAGGKLELRCDAESADTDDELWYIKMQAEFLGKMEEEIRRKERRAAPDDGLVIVKNLKALEDSNIRKFQTRGAGRLVSSTESVQALRKAREDGTIQEEMLNRRMKLKHDRFC